MIASESGSSEWTWRVNVACDAIAIAQGEGEAGLIRQMHAILCAAPPEVAAVLGLPCAGSRIDELLAAAAPREAAFQLIGRSGYMLSRSPAGPVVATIFAGDLLHETSAEAPSEAIALCAALAEGLRDWAARNGSAAWRRRAAH